MRNVQPAYRTKMNQPTPRLLSVVIITLNEAHTIQRCIESVRSVADEIVVADSGSTDGTPELAKSLGAKVLNVEWKGYAATKNEANAKATSPWILSLDADEMLTPELAREIAEAKDSGFPGGAYELRRLPFWGGKPIRHSGWNPDWKLRLFPRDKGEWVGEFVHETFQLSAGSPRPVRFSGLCHHYTMQGVTDHLRVIDKYTTLQAQEMWQRGKRTHIAAVWVKPAWEFFRCYWLKGGFRDGVEGYLVCRLNATTKFAKYAKLLMLQREASRGGGAHGLRRM